MDADNLDKLDAVIGAATPAPWEVRDGMNVKGASSLHVATTMGSETPRRDARAIAVTHNVMPELLAVVRAALDVEAELDDPMATHDVAVMRLPKALEALDAKLAEVLR